MRKITDFIINQRYLILILFIILAIVAVFLSDNVIINRDITKYLPNTSETRIGMNIMEDEFSDDESSSLSIMFSNLSNDDKLKIKQELENIEYVESVEYEQESDEYNKDNYTLYKITVNYPSDSKEATAVFNSINDKYKDYEFYTNGNIVEENKEVLAEWIVVLAVVCALIILIIMCPSYVEPFLFLFAILLAVLLNKGSNIIFDSVSNITESISAILQMALSMDYSIMLMNRYNQEKAKEKDKIKAMKNALYHSFQSISSSSITTVVGLLALVFMSFTIGKDLGLVLAKGVLLSLLCIFTCLPVLILIFDKWIEKTRKKALEMKYNKLGEYSYKCRFIGLPLLLLILVVSFMLKGNLKIEYLNKDEDKISEVFGTDNQIAIIYKNEYEDKIAKYCNQIENNDGIEELLGYGNTINKELKYDEFNKQLEDLGTDTQIDDYLLKILYYNYYNKDNQNKMTFNQFTKFIKNNVYSNSEMLDKIDDEMKKNIDKLELFTTKESANSKRTKQELANIFDIDKNSLDNLLIYYNSKNINITLTIKEFIEFMNKDVLTNSTYSSSIDNSTRNNLKTISKFIDKSKINKEMTADEISNLFGIDNNLTKQLFTYYSSLKEATCELSINEFANFLINDIANNATYSNLLDEATLTNAKLLAQMSNTSIINTEMTATELANIFGIKEEMVTQLLVFNLLNNTDLSQVEDLNTYISENMQNLKMSPYNFVKLILNNQTNPQVSGSLTAEILQNLNYLKMIMDSSQNNTKYSYNQMSELIGINKDTLKNIYFLYENERTTTKISPVEFVKFILKNKDAEALSGKINNSTLQNLSLINNIMNSVNNGTKYTHSQLSNLLGIDDNKLSILYSLYSSIHINSNTTLSINEFIDFILNDVVNNKDYASNFSEQAKSRLEIAKGIITNSINNTQYSASEIYAILSQLTDNLDNNLIDLVYLYYGSENEYNAEWTLTVEKLVNYINDEILVDERFDDFINEDLRNSITDAKADVDDAKELLVGDKYSRIVINTSLDEEGEEVYDIIKNIKENVSKDTDGIYVIGNSAMSYEMNQTFEDELNKITIITMIAIFIVVAITFKSITVPTTLVLIIQSAIYLTMGILAFSGEGVYFIALLIVQSILMGATIDYAIVFTSYYIESRQKLNKKESVINSFNNSLHTIFTSSSILIIVTFILGALTTGVTAKICKTLSLGTLCSTLLIISVLPPILALCDRVIVKRNIK